MSLPSVEAPPKRPPDPPAVLKLFHDELSLVDIIAKQVARTIRGVELDDLLSAGREGLLKAARRYDPSLGVPFRAYANICVRGAVLDGVRKMGPMSRGAYERYLVLRAVNELNEGHTLTRPFREQLDVTTDADFELAVDEHLASVVMAAAIGAEAARIDPIFQEDAEAEYERAELLAMVRREIENLGGVEATVIRRHYFEGHSLEEIAPDLNLSSSWLSRLHTKAIARLAERILPPE